MAGSVMVVACPLVPAKHVGQELAPSVLSCNW